MKKYQPLGDNCLVLPPQPKDKTDGGIVIPETVKDSNKPQVGRVLAAGPGRITERGDRLPMFVAKGDIVLFGAYAGVEQVINGKKCLIIRQDDLLMVKCEVEEEPLEAPESETNVADGLVG